MLPAPHPGFTFNESARHPDAATGRPTLRLTSTGQYNQTPTYHLGSAFSADSRYLLLVKERTAAGADEPGETMLLRGECETGDLTVLGVLPPDAGGQRFHGMDLASGRGRPVAVADVGGSVRLYGLHTFDERELLSYDPQRYHFGHPCVTADGERVIITRTDLSQSSPDRRPTDYVDVHIDTGRVEVAFHEAEFSNNHAQPSPTDPDLWLIDRDRPPGFGKGGDGGVDYRAALLHAPTGTLTPLRPDDRHQFTIHCNWSGDGQYILYHGRSLPDDAPDDVLGHRQRLHRALDGQYLGVFNTKGDIVWQTRLPNYHYGHVCTHPTRPEVILLDGLYTFDHLTLAHWRDHGPSGIPRVELLAKHATKWGGPTAAPGQYPHPHPHISPDGRWMSYNRGHADGRSDVYLVELDG